MISLLRVRILFTQISNCLLILCVFDVNIGRDVLISCVYVCGGMGYAKVFCLFLSPARKLTVNVRLEASSNYYFALSTHLVEVRSEVRTFCVHPYSEQISCDRAADTCET